MPSLAAALLALLFAQAAPTSDAGPDDAGVARDAGVPDDAGVARDAGVPDDAGGVGAGESANAALATDGGAPDEMAADDSDDADESADDGEADERAAGDATDGGYLYTRELSDGELKRRWEKQLDALGSISVGFADEGRVINAAHLENTDAWICQRPDLAYGTQETVDGLAAAFRAVHAQFPDSAPARLSHIGAREGGYLRPHRSHQSGRDADIGFFYKGDRVPGSRARREKLIDPARNWALLRALVIDADVQVVLVDRGIQKVLRDWALAHGEDRAWVDRLFHGGAHALIQHARRHKDHFHVRFYAPRSQELGRRIQPLLALRPEHNVALHRVRSGQTLGHIARLYGTSVAALMHVNHLKRTMIHVGQRITVPLHGPCTHCPLPPPVIAPPRPLPPDAPAAPADGASLDGGVARQSE